MMLHVLYPFLTMALLELQLVAVSTFRAMGIKMVQPDSPPHKLYYVAADIIKATVLAGLMASTVFWKAAVAAVWYDDWTTHEHMIRVMAIAYCATDAAQFLTVKMQRTTLAHHACTTLFGLYIALDGPFTPVCKAMLWYGLCSVVAYLVNAYKALRVVVDPSHRRMEVLRVCAKYMYALELVINWPVHVMLTVYAFVDSTSAVQTALAALYLVVTSVFVVDDLKLYRFLATKPANTNPH
jgi:hypothetical protein